MEKKYIEIIEDSKSLSTNWHLAFSIKVKPDASSYETLYFNEMSSGCGIYLLHGIKYLYNVPKEVLLEIKEFLNNELKDYKSKTYKYKDCRVGCIICTLGSGYINNEENLLFLGFKKQITYKNHKHNNGRDTQSLYTLEIL